MHLSIAVIGNNNLWLFVCLKIKRQCCDNYNHKNSIHIDRLQSIRTSVVLIFLSLFYKFIIFFENILFIPFMHSYLRFTILKFLSRKSLYLNLKPKANSTECSFTCRADNFRTNKEEAGASIVMKTNSK